MYNEKYLEAKDAYDQGSVEFALEEFKSFIAQNNHPINGMELTNSYRYIAKIYYELGNYKMSLKYWNLKSTRSAFLWKDFYCRALSAIFCSYYSIKDGNYILIKEDANHHEYNVLDLWLDLEITQILVRQIIAVKRPWSNEWQRYSRRGDDKGLRWLFEVLLNSQYYKYVTLNLILELKLLHNLDSFSLQKDKYKIYNKELVEIIKSESASMVDCYNDKSRLFEVCMGELSYLDTMRRQSVEQYYALYSPYRGMNSYETEFYETFDLIPNYFYALQEKSLADKLLYLLETLDSDSREWQIDHWYAELAQDLLKYLENLSDLNVERIKELLLAPLDVDEVNYWDRDWSAHSFLREHHQYRSTKENDGCHYFFWDQLLP